MSQFHSISNYITDFPPKQSIQIRLNIIACPFICPISVSRVEVDILGHWRIHLCVLGENNDGWCLIISCSLESVEKDEIKSLPLTSNPQYKPYPAKTFMPNIPHGHSIHICIQDNLNELLFFLTDQHMVYKR